MKKFLAILLCLCMVVTIVACNKADTNEETTTEAPATEAPTKAPEVNNEEENKAPVEAEYKLGMGVAVAFEAGAAQVDSTVAAVVTDANGKIVACRLDVAQNKFDLTADFATEAAKTFETKMERGDAYGMAAALNWGMDWNNDGVVKEWYDQAKAFEAYVVGMTGAEVAAIQTKVVEGKGYVIAADDALLSAGCTIQITDFVEAVVAACNDEQGMTFKTASEFTLGVAANSFANESVAATAEADATIAMYTDYAATVVVDGKIVAAINDAIQPKITATAAGEVVATEYTATKRNLKEAYNMATFGANLDPNGDGVVLEWYLQSEAFSKHVVGMTGAEVAGMETAANFLGYQMTTDTDLLTAGCTIQITAIKAVVAEAVTNAR